MPKVAEEKRMDYLGFCKEADQYNRETLKRHVEEEAQRARWDKENRERHEERQRYIEEHSLW